MVQPYKSCLFFLSVLVACAPGCSFHKNSTPNLPKPQLDPAEFSVPSRSTIPNGRAVVPFRWVVGVPVVSVFVNGRGPYDFLLDTGMTGLLLSPKIAGRCYTGGTWPFRDTAGTVMRCPLVRVDSLKLGEAEFRDVKGLAKDLKGFLDKKHGVELLGVLGIRCFAQCRLTLDFPSGVIIVESISESGEKPGRASPSLQLQRRSAGLPAVLVNLGGMREWFVIDSGNVGGFSVPGEVSGRLRLGATKPITKRSFHTTYRVRRSRLKGKAFLGQHELFNPPVEIGGRSFLIGTAVLMDFSVTIDQSSMRVIFAREADPSAPSR